MNEALAGLHLLLAAGLAVTYLYARSRNRMAANYIGSVVAADVAFGLVMVAMLLAGREHQLLLFAVRDLAKIAAICTWSLFVLRFTEYRALLTRRRLLAVGVPLVAAVVALATNPLHGLAYLDAAPGLHGTFYPIRGPIYWATFVIGYGVYVASLGLFLMGLYSSGSVGSPTSVGLMLATFPVFPIDLVDLLVIEPTVGISVMPFVGQVVGTVTTLLLARNDLLSVPIAMRSRVLDAIRDGIVVVRDGRVVDRNVAAAPFLASDPLGSPADEALDEPVRERLPMEVLSTGADGVGAWSDGAVESPEVAVTVGEGEKHQHFDLAVTSSPDEEGAVLTLRDVTALKRQERELERKNERLETFTGTVAHDLRNPLSVAQGYLDVAAGAEEADEHYDRVEESLDRMEAMITDLLELARQGQMVGATEPVDLAVAAREAWSVVDAPAAELVVESNGKVVADAERLNALLENLFRNAVEHGGEEVTVRVGELPDGFYVADDGPGIPAEKREEVFEHGHTTNEEGTGFGLSIVSEIASAHGWEVEAAESESGGARFEVTGTEPAAGGDP